MPSTLSQPEVAKLIVTREQAARIAGLHVSTLDRLKAQGRIPAITNERGRAIAYFRDDIMAMVGGGYRRKPGDKTKAEKLKRVGAACVGNPSPKPMPEHRNGEISGDSERRRVLPQTGPAEENSGPPVGLSETRRRPDENAT